MDKLLESLGKRIKAEMDRRGLDQKALEKKSGVPQSNISLYINAKKAITIKTLTAIADALDTTPADLLGGVTPPPAVEVLQKELRAAQDEILRLKMRNAELEALTTPAANKEKPPEFKQGTPGLVPQSPIPPDVAGALAALGPGHPRMDSVRAVLGIRPARPGDQGDPRLPKARK